MNMRARLTAWCVLCATLLITWISPRIAGAATIASKRQRNVVISLTNDSGKFVAGKNTFCVSFADPSSAPSIQVTNVAIEFAQQVGKIQEKPLKAALMKDTVGRYCGEIDLGMQYYHPAIYHITVHYMDLSGKKEHCHFKIGVS